MRTSIKKTTKKRITSLLAICVAMIGSSYAQNPFTTGGDYILRFCVSGDGSVVASDYVSDGKTLQMQVKKGQGLFSVTEASKLENKMLYNNAVYADKDGLVYRDAGTIYKYDFASEKSSALFEIKDNESTSLECSVISPNAKLLYTSSGSDIAIYNVKSGKLVESVTIPGDVIITNVYASDNNGVVLSTFNSGSKKFGVYEVTKKGKVTDLKETLEGITQKKANIVAPTTDKDIWLYTTAEGLFSYNLSTNSVSKLVSTEAGKDAVLEIRVAPEASKVYYKLASDLMEVKSCFIAV